MCRQCYAQSFLANHKTQSLLCRFLTANTIKSSRIQTRNWVAMSFTSSVNSMQAGASINFHTKCTEFTHGLPAVDQRKNVVHRKELIQQYHPRAKVI